MRSAWAEINLNNIKHNIFEIKKKINVNVKIMAIIKADAYGHGAVRVATFIEKYIDSFGVALTSEAIELRNNGVKKPILILGYSNTEDYELLIKNDITQSIFSKKQAFNLNKIAKKNKKIIKIHLKIETGMNRLGFIDNEKSLKEILNFKSLPFLNIEGIFSHIANSGFKNLNYTKNQIKRFKKFSNRVENIIGKKLVKHIANSSTLLEILDSHFQMVRPGILLYGSLPFNYKEKFSFKNKKALTLKSKIIQIKYINKNEPVSYNGTFISKKKSKIAIIPIGYADGIPRKLSNLGFILIKNKFVKIIGNICMDQLIIDITNIKNIKINDEVVIYGKNNPVENFANILDTIPYELYCSISHRIPRIYK